MKQTAKYLNIISLYLIIPLSGLSLTIDSPITEWTPVFYGDTNYPDYFADQQTGQFDSDIVGTNNAPAFYTKFDDAGTLNLSDDTLAFRVRMSGASKTYWKNVLFIGMDADANGSIDLFASLTKNKTIGLHYPGDGLNTSPNTTTIEKAFYSLTATDGGNYSFMPVDLISAPGQPTDIDGKPKKDPTDYCVTFSIEFSMIAGGLATNNIIIDETSPMIFLAATATQQNSLNQDLNGAPKVTRQNGDWTWVQLGASSTPMTPTGEIVPEPVTAQLLLLSGLSVFIYRRHRSTQDLPTDPPEDQGTICDA